MHWTKATLASIDCFNEITDYKGETVKMLQCFECVAKMETKKVEKDVKNTVSALSSDLTSIKQDAL